jgi:hypothetical protein
VGQINLFDLETERERIWRSLPEESRQQVIERLAALLVKHVEWLAKEEVGDER